MIAILLDIPCKRINLGLPPDNAEYMALDMSLQFRKILFEIHTRLNNADLNNAYLSRNYQMLQKIPKQLLKI